MGWYRDRETNIELYHKDSENAFQSKKHLSLALENENYLTDKERERA